MYYYILLKSLKKILSLEKAFPYAEKTEKQMLRFQIMSLKKKVSLGYLEGLNCLMGFLYLHCCWLLQIDAGVFCYRNSHLASHQGSETLPQHCHSRKMLSKRPL